MTLLSTMELIIDELREEEEFLEESLSQNLQNVEAKCAALSLGDEESLEESSLSDSESEVQLGEADDEEFLEESFDANPIDVDVVVALIRAQYLKDEEIKELITLVQEKARKARKASANLIKAGWKIELGDW